MNEEEKNILQNILSVVSKTNDKVDRIETKVDELDTKVYDLSVKVGELEKGLSSVKLTIENEIRPNISEIASCHLDLSKKLSNVTTSYEDYSNLQIQVRVLESQMNELKMAQ